MLNARPPVSATVARCAGPDPVRVRVAGRLLASRLALRWNRPPGSETTPCTARLGAGHTVWEADDARTTVAAPGTDRSGAGRPHRGRSTASARQTAHDPVRELRVRGGAGSLLLG